MRRKIVVGNWKMNGRIDTIIPLLTTICQTVDSARAECMVMPPSIYLPLVSDYLHSATVKWGAQNVYPHAMGPYTGELSGPMLKEYGCKYVLVGHSERRALFSESEKIIAEKFHHVKEHGMTPIFCIGETKEQRDQGLTNQVLISQLESVSAGRADVFDHCLIAYEPVWAIGTGEPASPEQVQSAHQLIRSFIAKLNQDTAQAILIIYGGSVTNKNAKDLFSMPDIDGGLVGGASLNAQHFVEIIQCIS